MDLEEHTASLRFLVVRIADAADPPVSPMRADVVRARPAGGITPETRGHGPILRRPKLQSAI